jgi:predicted enzyme related to lactoylglutathione lyase
MKEAFDVIEAGRMAVLQDPQGAVFAVWQPGQHFGVRVYGEPNTPCWAELATTDPEGARRFYSALFGWKADVKDPGPSAYTEWCLADGQVIGGMLKQDPKWGGDAPPHWLDYVAVPDCDATLKKAGEKGGRVLTGPIDMEHVGKFAALSDPLGAAFAVITPKPRP